MNFFKPILALLAYSALVPAASSQFGGGFVPCVCHGDSILQVYPNACVSPLGLTTNVSNGSCSLPGCSPKHCNWNLHFFAIERYECGNDWELFFDSGGQMGCGQEALNFVFVYKDGSVLATAKIRCKPCGS